MKINYLILLNFLFIFSISCQENTTYTTFIPANSNKISYQGRIGVKDSLTELYWPGSQIEINFNGTGINGIFKDDKGDNYYNVILDNDSFRLLRPDTSKKEYVLATKLPDTLHNIKIYKRTEWNRGTTTFYGFITERGTELSNPPPGKKRKMEFYGNSITAGYGVEDFSGKDRSDSIYTNNYFTYAAFTARHFNAECHYIVRSGIGILMSWVPQIMPEIYQLTNPHLSRSFWDFSVYQPDIVVINLFQNDSWLVKMPKSKEFQSRYEGKKPPEETDIVGAYVQFVTSLRDKYPNAHIICMLGNMSITKIGSPWPGYVQEAVDFMNDPNIYTFFVPYKDTPGHPKIHEQREMANKLIRFIEKNIQW